MKNILLALTVFVFAGMLSSCATIMRDKTQIVPITSSVNQVNIKITDKGGRTIFEGQTPTTLTLNTSSGGYFNPEKYTVTASKPGYKDQTIIVDWHVSNWYIYGNLMFGGLIGYLIVDPLTGDMYYLDENVNLNMEQE
jgi:hypothetical protein